MDRRVHVEARVVNKRLWDSDDAADLARLGWTRSMKKPGTGVVVTLA
jgi:hypothetical protein